jgi:histidinol-phosphate aminotransferase
MPIHAITRRGFAATLGAAVGGVLLEPRLGSARAEAALPEGAPSDIIQLNANENPYGLSPAAREAFAGAAQTACRYPDSGVDRMRGAIAAHHGVSVEQITLGCGSSEILQMADRAFLGAGKRVVAAEPTFEAVLSYARVTRAEPVKVPLTSDFRHDLDRMAEACDERAGLVYVCNPNNPTGTVVSGKDLAGFVARVPRSCAVLVDEAYHHFVEDPGYRSSDELIAAHPNIIVARTFSKIYGMAGLRLGYAVSSPATIRALRRQASWDNVNGPALAAARTSLEERDLVPQRRRLINDTRKWLCAELARDGRRAIPSEANFVMIDVGGDVNPIIASFRERKILVGRKFPSMPRWLRVSIGTREEMTAFLEALRAIVPTNKSAAA